MFNGKRIAALEQRIKELEAQVKLESRVDMEHLWSGGIGFEQLSFSVVPRKISVCTAIQAMLDHLGMQLKFEDGTAERLVLQKKAKGK